MLTSWLLPKAYCVVLGGTVVRERQTYDLAIFCSALLNKNTVRQSLCGFSINTGVISSVPSLGGYGV